jgi:ATP-dependent protease ClpP protease subunit
MVSPDYNYRVNPARTIYVVGDFNDDLLQTAIPRIAELRFENKDPISVVINSQGGDAICLEALIAALSVTDPDGNESRVITSVAGNAASAGAILLTSADYAIATVSSVIHFHGIRLSEYEITTESAAQIANNLSRKNTSIADEMARAMMPRIVHRFLRLKSEIDAFKKRRRSPRLAPVLAFAELAKERTSGTAEKIFVKTVNRLIRVRHISSTISKIKFNRTETNLQKDAKLLKHIIDYELKDKASPVLHLNEGGIGQVMSDYMMIRDFTSGHHMYFLDELIALWGPDFLTEKDLISYNKQKSTSEKKAYAFLRDRAFFSVQDFWYLTVSIARALLRGENRLSSIDAYWLGAIDEITGDPDSYGIRAMMEKELKKPSSSPAS